MMDQFYVTLPSNTQSDLNNTQSKYTVLLPQRLRLQGDWECGLCEIIYPHNWLTVNELDSEIKIKDTADADYKIKIPVACYDSINDLIDAIQYIMKRDDVNLQENVTFSYTSIMKRVYVKLKKDGVVSVKMSPNLSKMLGLPVNVIKRSTWGDKEPCIINGGLDAMYVYANLVEQQIVGDISAPLLRIVNVEGKYPQVINRIYDFPHYVRVLVKDIADIEINIKNDQNEFVSFVSGKVIIKLHFRRVKHSLF